MPDLYVAIDAGQSHTECVAVDVSGSVVALGNGGPSYAQDGSPLVVSAFDEAISGLPAPQAAEVRAVLVGATGHAIPGRAQAIHDVLRARFPNAVLRVAGDAEFVRLSYHGDGPGGVLIAGTGCIATGAWAGRQATAGGYGYLFGDQGGGAGLVFHAVRRCLELADSRSPLPPLAAALCAYFGVDDIRGVPGELYANPPLDVRWIAGAAPLVAAAADGDDVLAIELLEACGRELAALAGRLCLALDVPAGARFVLIQAGGIWRIRAALPAAFVAALPPAVNWELRTIDASPTLHAARYARTLGSAPDSRLVI